MSELSDFNRIEQLYAILTEVKYIREYLLPAIEKETLKGIKHIEDNSQEFFFPELGYLFEKTNSIKSSVERIEWLADYKTQ